MRILWLSYELDECAVTRGLFRKRRAIVSLIQLQTCSVWRYVNSGADVEWWLAREIEIAQTKERKRRQRDQDWERVSRRQTQRSKQYVLPPVRLVKP